MPTLTPQFTVKREPALPAPHLTVLSGALWVVGVETNGWDKQRLLWDKKANTPPLSRGTFNDDPSRNHPTPNIPSHNFVCFDSTRGVYVCICRLAILMSQEKETKYTWNAILLTEDSVLWFLIHSIVSDSKGSVENESFNNFQIEYSLNLSARCVYYAYSRV